VDWMILAGIDEENDHRQSPLYKQRNALQNERKRNMPSAE
jgi:hypothetical protein